MKHFKTTNTLRFKLPCTLTPAQPSAFSRVPACVSPVSPHQMSGTKYTLCRGHAGHLAHMQLSTCCTMQCGTSPERCELERPIYAFPPGPDSLGTAVTEDKIFAAQGPAPGAAPALQAFTPVRDRGGLRHAALMTETGQKFNFHCSNMRDVTWIS